VLFLLLAGLFRVAGVIGVSVAHHVPELADQASGNRSAALFFSVIVAYIVPVFHYICERTVQAIDQIGPDLPASAGPVDAIRARVHHKSRTWFVTVLTIGTAAAVGHNLVLALDDVTRAGVSFAWLAMVFGTALTWIVMTLVIAALISNAVLMYRLACEVRLNPLAPDRLRPFASVAVLSTLAIVGAQAAFPIMFLDARIGAIVFLPGLIATVVPMIVLALLPIWPLHRRLKMAKQSTLAQLNQQIASFPLPAADAPQPIGELLPLLGYRREVQALPEWPFDMRTLGRLALYLIIPPLTWVGAALIENVVNAML